jgi:N-acetylneuraminic acid mutarotase
MNPPRDCPICLSRTDLFPPRNPSRRACFSLLLFLILLLASAASALAQNNEWTWISGPETPQPPVYGTEGVAAAGNFPGNRESAAGWTDSQGNLWLFGGNGYDSQQQFGSLNDLWKFDPATREWTWMGGLSTLSRFGSVAQGSSGTQGVADPGNLPQGRAEAVYWKDAQGNFWLFGGYDYYSQDNYYNDLWEYNPTTHEWVWVTGEDAENCTSCDQPGVYGTEGVASKTNTPGSRIDAVTWTDKNGNLWLFGGHGFDANDQLGFLNDLWKFDPSTQEWTWVGGSSAVPAQTSGVDGGVPGVYGVKGTGSSANIPGGRDTATGWVDAQGNLWLFGGIGIDASGNLGILNDLWEYTPTTNQWTWINGSDTRPSGCATALADACGAPGVYGTLGQSSAANTPGSRREAVGWTDNQGNLWLIGGSGVDSTGKIGYLNDLWEYDPTTNRWTWMRGSSTVACPAVFCGEPGSYGTQGVADLSNDPAGRSLATAWTDTNGNFWLFGGEGNNIVSTFGYFQDMWEFQPNTGGQPVVSTPTFSPAPGSYTTPQAVSISDATSGAAIQYLINGNGPSVPYTGPLSVSSSETITAIANASGYASSNLAVGNYSLQITPTATPTFSPGSGTYSTAQTVTISDTTPGVVIYYTTDRSVPTVHSNVYSGPVTVSSSETIQAIAVASGYGASPLASAVFTIGSGGTGSEWAWFGGNGLSDTAVYGTEGQPATTNLPGSREDAASWTDSQGNFWLFGGKGLDASDNSGYLNDLWEYSPSARAWAWMGGSNTIPCTVDLGVKNCTGTSGVYGVQGTASPSNFPGGREGAAHWVDAQGNLWLFGGYGIDSHGQESWLNDLWKFDLSTHEWTWVAGSSTEPLERGGLGEPGIYGTVGQPGPDNIPGSRIDAATWTGKDGNLWLYGGTGFDSVADNVILDDLWKYNPSTNEWTWMGGSNKVNVGAGSLPGVFGTMGVANGNNYPPSLAGAATWVDANDNLWMFGGEGGSGAELNDLWEYDPSSNEWAWMKGNGGAYCPVDPLVGGPHACTSSPAVVGALGVPSSQNTPAGGSNLAAWTDKDGNFWLFGGQAPDITGENDGFYQGQTNALWVYSPAVNEWTWMGGDLRTSNCSAPILQPLPSVVCDGAQATYGTYQTPDPISQPGARKQAVAWTDTSGNLWLFSGATLDLENYDTYANDLWEYAPSLNTLPAATKPIFSLKAGTYTNSGALILSDGIPNATIYYTTDGTAPTTSSAQFTGPITIASSQMVEAFATAPGYRDSVVSSVQYTFPSAPPAPTISPASETYTPPLIVTMADTDTNAAIYYTTDGTAPVPSSSVYQGPITVSSTETIHALAAVTGFFVWDGIAADFGAYRISPDVSATYSLPVAATPTFSVPSGTYTAVQTVALSDSTPGAVIHYTTNGYAPTASSPIYTQPITVSLSETIQAMAIATGYDNSAVASAQYSIHLPQPEFSMTVSSPSLTIAAGRSATDTIQITPQNGFNDSVSFQCSGLPANASCLFTPAAVTPAGSAVSSTLTILTTNSTAALSWLPGSTFACLFGFFFWKKKCPRVFALLLIVAGGLTFLGCGGGSVGGTTTTQQKQPVTSTVTITAVSGSLHHTATISLTVNP